MKHHMYKYLDLLAICLLFVFLILFTHSYLQVYEKHSEICSIVVVAPDERYKISVAQRILQKMHHCVLQV